MAGSVIFLILLVLLIWMICVRANRTRKTPEKILSAAAEQNGSQVSIINFSRLFFLIFPKSKFIKTACCEAILPIKNKNKGIAFSTLKKESFLKEKLGKKEQN